MDSSKVIVLDTRNAVGVALSDLVAFISGPGGQGGGSFYIPLFTALLGFSVNQAAALSSAVVLFGCISMVIQAVFTPHPQSPGLPVVDYTLVLALTPCLMLGLALGVLLNAVMSQWLLNIIVVSVWSWSCVQLSYTYRKARAREWQHKLAQKEAKQAPDVATSVAPLAVVVTAQAGKEATAGADKQPKQVAQGPESLMTLTGVAAVCRHATHSIRSWSSRQPWGCIATIAGLFTFFIASQVVRGSLLAQSSAGWWAVLGVVCGVSLSAGVLVSVWLLRQQAQHTGANPLLQACRQAATRLQRKHHCRSFVRHQRPLAVPHVQPAVLLYVFPVHQSTCLHQRQHQCMGKLVFWAVLCSGPQQCWPSCTHRCSLLGCCWQSGL